MILAIGLLFQFLPGQIAAESKDVMGFGLESPCGYIVRMVLHVGSDAGKESFYEGTDVGIER